MVRRNLFYLRGVVYFIRFVFAGVIIFDDIHLAVVIRIALYLNAVPLFVEELHAVSVAFEVDGIFFFGDDAIFIRDDEVTDAVVIEINLIADADWKITGYKMRCPQSKLTTVKALQSCGFETIAAGDSFNDLGMIRASKAGFLFRSTEKIKADNPDLPAFETYEEFLNGIEKALE